MIATPLKTAASAAVFPSDANWHRIDYLALGNARQQSAFRALTRSGFWPALQGCGECAFISTVAIGLDRPGSDLDLLSGADPETLARALAPFGPLTLTPHASGASVLHLELADGTGHSWPIEVFATALPLPDSNGWRHLAIMGRLLHLLGEPFAAQILAARQHAGLKGEAAMARALGLDGDPYQAMLTLEPYSDPALLALWTP